MIYAAILNMSGANQLEDCLYVGDRTEDRLSAKAASIQFMWADDWKNQTKML
jgi:phosphoglycolate phosphatase-like HAD superfamily hydrolase